MPRSIRSSTSTDTGRRKVSTSSKKPASKSASSHRGIYFSDKTRKQERYDSTYELIRFQALDLSPLVLKWTRNHRIKIPYRMGRRRRRYLPDILVHYLDGRIYLEEVKGKVWNRWEFALKNVAAMLYCYKMGYTFRIIFREQLDSVV